MCELMLFFEYSATVTIGWWYRGVNWDGRSHGVSGGLGHVGKEDRADVHCAVVEAELILL